MLASSLSGDGARDGRLVFRRVVTAFVAMAACLAGVVVSTAPAQASPTLTLDVAPNGAGSACDATTPCGLQQALTDAATDNPAAPVKITLSTGVYSGAFVWDDSSGSAPSTLTLVGPGTLAGATIDAGGAGPALTVSAPAGTVELLDLTLTGGSAPFGAGIDETAGSLRVESSTIAADHATVAGGAIDVAEGSALLEGTTIAGDNAVTDGALAASPGASLTLHADVLGGDGPVPACDSGAITDGGYDVTDDASCLGAQPAATSTRVANDTGLFAGPPQLAPGGQEGPVVPLLGNRGDPGFDDVPTSVASLVSSGSFCSKNDERGAARLQLGATACDSGSMQFSPAILTAVQPTSGEPGTTVSVTGGGFLVETTAILGSTPVVARVLSDRSLSFTVPPTAAGPSSITVATADGTATLPGAFDVITALAVSTSSLPEAEVGAPYDVTLQAAGGSPPYSWSSQTSLPSGLSLATGGMLSGTPQVSGSVVLVLEVRDSSHVTVSTDLDLLVQPPPMVAMTSLPTGQLGQTYSASLAAQGGTPPYTWSIASGGIPPGLLLSSDGTLSGIPGAAGASTLDLRVTDTSGASAEATLSFTVLAAPLPAQRYGVLSSSGTLWLSDGGSIEVPLSRRQPVVAIAAAPTGWWVVTRSGRVIGLGGARSLGSLRSRRGTPAVSGLAAVRGGYFVLTSSGAVFSFGTAQAAGSLALRPGGVGAVGIAAASRRGYWVLEANGTVTSFGSARRLGSPPTHEKLGRFVGIAADPSGMGYWVVTGNGTVLAFGSAVGDGSVPASAGAGRISAIAAAPDGSGYWVVSSRGELFAFGSARLAGSSGQGAASGSAGETTPAGGTGAAGAAGASGATGAAGAPGVNGSGGGAATGGLPVAASGASGVVAIAAAR